MLEDWAVGSGWYRGSGLGGDGAVETDFGGGAVRDNPQINSFVAAQTALGRVGMADDIGGVISSLLSDDTRGVNAQRIEASGGMFI